MQWHHAIARQGIRSLDFLLVRQRLPRSFEFPLTKLSPPPPPLRSWAFVHVPGEEETEVPGSRCGAHACAEQLRDACTIWTRSWCLTQACAAGRRAASGLQHGPSLEQFRNQIRQGGAGVHAFPPVAWCALPSPRALSRGYGLDRIVTLAQPIYRLAIPALPRISAASLAELVAPPPST